MNDDTDVLMLLRKAAVDDAPALTLQADDLVRTGRRRRRTTRIVGAGAGVVVATGAFVFATAQDDARVAPTTPAAVEQTGDVAPSPETLHMMPALLKEVALSPFDELPKWTMFDISAYDETQLEGFDPTPLPEKQWAEATKWVLRGATDHGAIVLSVRSEPGFISAKQACDMYAAGTVRSCDAQTLPDGRTRVTTWSPGEPRIRFGDATLTPANAGEQLYVVTVAVHDRDSLQRVTVEEAVSAPSFEDASDRLWLSQTALVDMATNPDLKLGGVLQPLHTMPSG